MIAWHLYNQIIVPLGLSSNWPVYSDWARWELSKNVFDFVITRPVEEIRHKTFLEGFNCHLSEFWTNLGATELYDQWVGPFASRSFLSFPDEWKPKISIIFIFDHRFWRYLKKLVSRFQLSDTWILDQLATHETLWPWSLHFRKATFSESPEWEKSKNGLIFWFWPTVQEILDKPCF